MAGLATVGFVGTNYNNVYNKGDWTRVPVLAGQCFNAVEEGVKLNNSLALKTQNLANSAVGAETNGIFRYFCKGVNFLDKKIRAMSNTIENLAKTDKLLNYSTKAINFVKHNINPLIVASSTVKVALAKKEDRRDTFFAEAGCVSGMFLGEGYMKKNLDKYLNKLPINKKWLPLIKGVVFVSGSITASTIGQQVGKKIAQYWDVPLGKSDREAKAKQANFTYNKVYTPINLKA
jgi:hypothetical protein